MTKNNHEFDGFSVKLFIDTHDDWVAFFEEMPNVSAFAATPAAALAALETAWTLVKEDYAELGQSLPKPRIKDDQLASIVVEQKLHQLLLQEAEQRYVSLSEIVAQKLAASSPWQTGV